jgi:hypothetical protein
VYAQKVEAFQLRHEEDLMGKTDKFANRNQSVDTQQDATRRVERAAYPSARINP